MIIGFIEHLQIVTSSNRSAIFNSHTPTFTTARIKTSHSAVSLPRCLVMAFNAVDPSASVFSSFCPHSLTPVSQLDSALATQWLPIIKAPPPPTPSPGATLCIDLRCLQTANCKLITLDRILQTLGSDSRLTGLPRWFSWYSLGTDSTEKTASHKSSIVAWRHYRRGPTDNTVPSGTSIGHVAWREVFHFASRFIVP
jgi:hypothetical protein